MIWLWVYFFYFFFSSRRRHTRFKCDWSSDVCSSDLVGDLEARVADLARLLAEDRPQQPLLGRQLGLALGRDLADEHVARAHLGADARSEERRVGKECRSRWSPYH